MLSKPMRVERIPEAQSKIFIFPFDLLNLILYEYVTSGHTSAFFLGRSTPEMAVAIANEWFILLTKDDSGC